MLKDNKYSESDKDYSFTKNIDEITIIVNLSYQKKHVLVKVLGACLQVECIEELKTAGSNEGENLSEPCRESINNIINMATQFTKDILVLIKYHLGHEHIQENLLAFKSKKWGYSDEELHNIPSLLTVIVSSGSRHPLDDDSFQLITESLDTNISPLLAMRHLHRAKHERSPHHQWIDATIAAELAIKEVLSRAIPELEVLLLNVPSPPLSKLYGEILKTYLGEESPYRKKSLKGQKFVTS